MTYYDYIVTLDENVNTQYVIDHLHATGADVFPSETNVDAIFVYGILQDDIEHIDGIKHWELI